MFSFLSHIKCCLLLATIVFTLFACEKKVELDISPQAKIYPVIFGNLSNNSSENKIEITYTKNFADKSATAINNAKFSIITPDTLYLADLQSNGIYTTNLSLMPLTRYTFNCQIASVNYSYSTFTSDYVYIDSVFSRPLNLNENKITAKLSSFSPEAIILKEILIAEIKGSDTSWVPLADKFPNYKQQSQPYAPLFISFKPDGTSELEILTRAQFIKGTVLKIRLSSIDYQAAGFLFNHQVPSLFITTQSQPQQPQFVFSDEALGIIIPRLTVEYVTTVK